MTPRSEDVPLPAATQVGCARHPHMCLPPSLGLSGGLILHAMTSGVSSVSTETQYQAHEVISFTTGKTKVSGGPVMG
jgi:hypothetical protein